MGLASIWGTNMYPKKAKVVDPPTRRKCRAPRPARGAGPQPGTTVVSNLPSSGPSCGFEGEQSDTTSVNGEPVEHPVPAEDLVSADTEGVGSQLPPCWTPEDAPGAVPAEAAVQLGVPVAGKGEAGGAPPGRVAQRDPSLSIPMWTPTTTLEHQGCTKCPRTPSPPRGYPFVIPKSAEKVSLILSCVKHNSMDGSVLPTFRLDFREDLARALAMIPPGQPLFAFTLTLRTHSGLFAYHSRDGEFSASGHDRICRLWSWSTSPSAGSTVRTFARQPLRGILTEYSLRGCWWCTTWTISCWFTEREESLGTPVARMCALSSRQGFSSTPKAFWILCRWFPSSGRP